MPVRHHDARLFPLSFLRIAPSRPPGCGILPFPFSIEVKHQLKQKEQASGASDKSVTTLRCGDIKATNWKHTGEKDSFYSTTFPVHKRTVRDSGKILRPYGLVELEPIVTLTAQAKGWILAERTPEASGFRAKVSFIFLNHAPDHLRAI